jgi:hypothetical protein
VVGIEGMRTGEGYNQGVVCNKPSQMGGFKDFVAPRKYFCTLSGFITWLWDRKVGAKTKNLKL